MEDKYSLNLFSSVLLGKAPLGDIKDISVGWERSTMRDGGYDEGRFTVSYESLTRDEMTRWFYNYLGYHIEESTAGDITWEGQIFEMDLVLNGHRKRRTLEHYDPNESLANWILPKYTDEDNKIQTLPEWANLQSIDRYGRYEEIIRLDGYDSTAVAAKRGLELSQRSWPFARTVSLSQKDTQGDRLEIRAWGYVYTTNNRFVTAADGVKGNVSTWISNIGNTDLDYVKPGKIQENTLQVTRIVPLEIRAWDKLKELNGLGDEYYEPWRIWVSRGRLLNYEKLDPKPIYYWSKGRVLDLNSNIVPPRLVVPGVIRDIDYPESRAEPGSFFEDARDSFLDQISVNADGELDFVNPKFSDARILATQSTYYQTEKQQLEQMKNG